ncbi:MAG: isoleucine--tRNA ligase [Bacilli bacterium]|nr:isoleucine--tRNA ligase [Bacilli bacterium]
MDYKPTLHMPQTAFPMRAGLAQKEPGIIEMWKKIDLYHKMNENRVNAPLFALHDGPPYANGDMHCGHALNRTLKDIVIRYKNMARYQTPFVFGWDTHGLPIEVKVTKSGVDRKKTPIVEFRSICETYARSQVERQKAQIERLGCMGDYAHPYLTLLPEYEARQIEVFAKMALKGLIFKGLKPVYWSWSSESALAEAEVEYHDVEAITCFVPLKVKDGKGLLPLDASVVIWTTTPWTLPSNQAVTANPDFEYGLFETEKGKLVFLASKEEELSEKLGLGQVSCLKKFKGKDLEGIILAQPIYPEKDSPVLSADFVTDDAGSGFVHTDSDHGLDDYNVCAKYGIHPQGLVDSHGVYHTFEGDFIDGKFYEEVNRLVVERLESEGRILQKETIVHSYPHDWRTKKPIIFRATPQWFCSISPIREDLLKAVHQTAWYPKWGEMKMVNMIKDRADWCISRQRAWGVPIPIIYNEDGSPILEKEVFDHIESLIREHGSNIWFSSSVEELLPPGYRNPKSPNGKFTKEKDIMDVWFDSGSSWNGVMVERGLGYPADLYLEGNDQYRGWFNSSLIVSLASNGIAPFKTVLTHGFVMDESWQKMSKSSGNGIDPNKIISTYGADILRLWVGSVDYQADARLGESILSSVIDIYRKIRNSFRFLLANIEGYEGQEVSYEKDDLYILSSLEEMKNKALSAYDAYAFRAVIDAVTSFITGDLSSFYMDEAKDVLYCDDLASKRRQAKVAVFYEICKTLVLLLNPILPFTCEEVYSYMPGEKKESVQLEDMVKASHDYEAYQEEFVRFKALRDVMLKELENARASGQIGSSGEADVELTVGSSSLMEALQAWDEDSLKRVLMVSSFTLKEGKEDNAKVTITDAPSCARCRNHDHHHQTKGEETLCDRCAEVLGL